MTTTTYPTELRVFRVNANYVPESVGGSPAQPQQLTIEARTADVAEAEAIAAGFPKSCRVSTGSITTSEKDDEGRLIVQGYIQLYISLKANRSNGGVNESGLRRYRSFRRSLDQRGYGVEWAAPYVNSYATEADFESAIG